MNNIRKAGLGYTIGNVLLKGIVFFSLPIFTSLLDTASFGVFNNYIAYEGILSAVLGLGIYGTIKKAYFDFKNEFQKYLSTTITLILCFSLFLLLLICLFSKFIIQFTGFSFLIILLCVLQSFGSAVLQIYSTKLFVEFKYKLYLFISLTNTIFNIGLSIIFILFVFPNERAVGRVLGYALPLIIIGFVISICLLIKGKSFFNKKYMKYCFLLGLPLVPHVIAQYILNQSDRIMISKMISDSASGIYSYAFSICSILFVVFQSLEGVWTPWTYFQREDNKLHNVLNASKRYMIFAVTLYIGFICVSPEIFKLMAPQSYWEGVTLIVPLALSMFFMFMYYLPVNIEYYHKKTYFVSIGTCIATLINVLLNLFLIPKFGYVLAGYTTLISNIILFLIHFFISFKFNMKKWYPIKYIWGIIIMVGLSSISFVYICNYNLLSIVFRYIICFIDIVFIMIFFKKDIKKMFRGKKSAEEFD